VSESHVHRWNADAGNDQAFCRMCGPACSRRTREPGGPFRPDGFTESRVARDVLGYVALAGDDG
jgi:hypothetical protein